MEPFLIGCGIGCLIGVAAAYLIISRPQKNEPPSWLQLLDQQLDAIEEVEGNRIKPQAITRLRSKDITWEIGNA